MAVNRLLKDNQGLKRSRRSLADAKKAKADAWRSLIPKFSIFFGLSTLLSDISELDLDDITGQVRAGFNIPSPFAFYARLYATDLSAISSEWSHEVDRRRAHRELYVAFLRAKDLEEQREEIEAEQERLSQVSLKNLSSRLKQVETSLQNYSRNYEQSRLSLNRLLGTPGGHWKPTGPLPDISYASRFEDLELGENIGKLGLKLEAARTEVAHLSVTRVKLQRWPSINFGLSGPALFSTSDSNQDFELGNFNFFSGLSETIDITDPLDRQGIQEAEIRLEATIARMRETMESEIVQFDQAKQDYRRALKKKRIINRQLQTLERSQVTTAKALLENFEKAASLRFAQRQVEVTIGRLDLEYWIWDDNAW